MVRGWRREQRGEHGMGDGGEPPPKRSRSGEIPKEKRPWTTEELRR